MIDQDKMRALARQLRDASQAWFLDDPKEHCASAADAIDLLLAEVEAANQKRKEAQLDAEKARDERNRAHVKLNAEWIEKTNALRAELEAAAADKRDAERYRWLRDKANFAKGWAPMVFNCAAGAEISWQNALHDGWLDDSIDAALAQRQGEGS